MAVVFDTSASGIATGSTNLDLDVSLTVGTGDDMIIVGKCGTYSGSGTITSVTYDPTGTADAFTKFVEAFNGTKSSYQWYLLDGPIIHSAARVVRFSSAVGARKVGIPSSWTTVDQTTPLEDGLTDTGTGTAAGTAGSSGAGEPVVDFLMKSGTSIITINAGQTLINNESERAAASYEFASDGTGMTWVSIEDFAYTSARIKEAAAGGPVDLPYQPWQARGPILAQ